MYIIQKGTRGVHVQKTEANINYKIKSKLEEKVKC